LTTINNYKIKKEKANKSLFILRDNLPTNTILTSRETKSERKK